MYIKSDDCVILFIMYHYLFVAYKQHPAVPEVAHISADQPSTGPPGISSSAFVFDSAATTSATGAPRSTVAVISSSADTRVVKEPATYTKSDITDYSVIKPEKKMSTESMGSGSGASFSTVKEQSMPLIKKEKKPQILLGSSIKPIRFGPDDKSAFSRGESSTLSGYKESRTDAGVSLQQLARMEMQVRFQEVHNYIC